MKEKMSNTNSFDNDDMRTVSKGRKRTNISILPEHRRARLRIDVANSSDDDDVSHHARHSTEPNFTPQNLKKALVRKQWSAHIGVFLRGPPLLVYSSYCFVRMSLST